MHRWRSALALVGAFVLTSSLSLAQQSKPAQKPTEKKEVPAQASVASKQAFGTISAKAPELAKAVKATDLEAVKKLVGKNGALKGTVVKVYASRNHSIVILNFAQNYKEAATVVLKPANYARFPNLETLKDKTVYVTGKVILFQERPEIELVKPDQLKVVP